MFEVEGEVRALKRHGAGAPWALALALALDLVVGGPSFAATAGPSIKGSIQGGLKRGSHVVFRLEATEPGGWQEVSELDIAMVLHDLVLAQISYIPGLNTISIRGGSLVQVGTPAVLLGSFFRVSGLDVTATTGGERIAVTIRAGVLEDIPAGTRFRLVSTDKSGASASVSRAANVEPQARNGFSWGTLAVAILGALFAGSFIGGLFASRRRPVARASIYAAVARRIEETREGK